MLKTKAMGYREMLELRKVTLASAQATREAGLKILGERGLLLLLDSYQKCIQAATFTLREDETEAMTRLIRDLETEITQTLSGQPVNAQDLTMLPSYRIFVGRMESINGGWAMPERYDLEHKLVPP